MFESQGRIHVHFAIPFYAGDQLVRSLIEISASLRKTGVSVPDPKKYRDIFGRKIRGEEGGAFMPLEIERMSEILDETADLIILSFNDLMAPPANIFDGGVIYGEAHHRIEYLRNLFPNREMTLFFSAANPGSVMAAMLNSGAMNADRAQKMSQVRPLWCELTELIDTYHPDLPVILWANEDTPVTWPAVLREILGLEEGTAVPGGLHMAGALLDGKARAALASEIKTAAPKSEWALMNILDGFLSKNVDRERTEFEVDHPGWDQETLDDFTLLYEQDMDACLDLEQVSVMTLETMLEDRRGARAA